VIDFVGGTSVIVGHEGKEKILEIERGSTRSHSMKNSLWKRLRTCRKTDYRMKWNEQMIPITKQSGSEMAPFPLPHWQNWQTLRYLTEHSDNKKLLNCYQSIIPGIFYGPRHRTALSSYGYQCHRVLKHVIPPPIPQRMRVCCWDVAWNWIQIICAGDYWCGAWREPNHILYQ
jgi:hypothetical protein